jgi:hypothetical protein
MRRTLVEEVPQASFVEVMKDTCRRIPQASFVEVPMMSHKQMALNRFELAVLPITMSRNAMEVRSS